MSPFHAESAMEIDDESPIRVTLHEEVVTVDEPKNQLEVVEESLCDKSSVISNVKVLVPTKRRARSSVSLSSPLPKQSTPEIRPKKEVSMLTQGLHFRLRSRKQRPSLSGHVTYGRRMRESVDSQVISIDLTRYKRWQHQIKTIDHRTEFGLYLRSVFHVPCGRWVKVDGPYDCTKFRKHYKRCLIKLGNGAPGMRPRKAAAAGNTLITSYFAVNRKKQVSKPREVQTMEFPCPGIRVNDDPRVEVYLTRTGASGGGARSEVILAKEIFGRAYSTLNKKQKKEIQDRRQASFSWRNDHERQTVFSVKCGRSVQAESAAMVVKCPECAKVLRLKQFQNVLGKPMPKAENLKYVNNLFRNDNLAHQYLKIKGLGKLLLPETEVIHFHFLLGHY